MATEPTHDAAAIIDFARANLAELAEITTLDEHRHLVRTPPGWTQLVVDEERFAVRPRRARGTVAVYDAASFLAAVVRRELDAAMTVIYADEATAGLVAVLNDDEHGVPGWGDYRVALLLRRTEEWDRWRKGQGLVEQDVFVARMEAGITEIREPVAVEVLELVRRFEAVIKVRWSSKVNHVSGAQAIEYEETVDAKGGGGTMEIPETLKIHVRPFYGSPAVEVVCRVKTKPRDGKLQIGYAIESPTVTEVERLAFAAVVAEVEAGIDALILRAPAPGSIAPL